MREGEGERERENEQTNKQTTFVFLLEIMVLNC